MATTTVISTLAASIRVLFRSLRRNPKWPSLVIAAMCSLLVSGCKTNRLDFYPIGIYSVQTNDFEIIRGAGFNIIRGPAQRSFLDAAALHDLKVLAEPRTMAGTNFNALRARNTVKAFDSHRALWAWYLIDEPDLNQVSPEDVRDANRFVKNVTGRKPTALVLFQGSQALNYAGLSDILMVDRYPIPWLPLANFPQHVRMAKLAAGDRQPLIAVIQAFDWSYYPKLLSGEKDLRPPTFQEIRCMTYSALAQRANGLFYYCFNDGLWKMEEHPREWGALRAVVSEVNDRQPLFEAEHIWWPLVHTYDDPSMRFNAALESSITPALLRVKKGNETVPAGDYLLAVNTTEKSMVYRIQLPFLATADVPLLGEKRSVAVHENWIQDKFEPYAVHVYGPLTRTASKRTRQ